MNIPNFYEEFIVLSILLAAVVVIYIVLKLHYHFAFGLLKDTASYVKNKQKIDKAKYLVFFTLKILLWLGLVGTFIVSISILSEGVSLKGVVFEAWAKIPEGFWLEALFIVVKIVLVVVVSRYILRLTYGYLNKKKDKAIQNKCEKCTEINIIRIFNRLHNMVKYTVILGIMYRITAFFSFLKMISVAILISLILFFIVSMGLLGVSISTAMKEKKYNE